MILLSIQLLLILTPIVVIIYYYTKHNICCTIEPRTHQYLSNKTIWITGASSGIGQSIAIQCSQLHNTQLILSARNIEQLNYTAQQCMTYNQKNKPLIVALDSFELANNSNKSNDIVQNTLQQLHEQYSITRIDVLINSSGISVRGNAIDTKLDVDHQVMNCNYFGTISLVKAVLQHIRTHTINNNNHNDDNNTTNTTTSRASATQQPDYNIVQISSVQGLIGNGLRSSYAASKFALHGYYESLRYELYDTLPHIHLSLICPGYVNTNLSMNALTSSGVKHNKLDASTANGQSSDIIAIKVLNVISMKQDYVLLADMKTHIACWLYQFAPAVLCRVMSSRANKERLTMEQDSKFH